MEVMIPQCIAPGGAPAPFRFYIIFHKFLAKEAYEKLNPHYIQKYCRFIGVNRSIEKRVDDFFIPFIFEETQLPTYDPFLQFNKFCESSVFFHTVKNAPLLLNPFEFVGFLHYDMVLENEFFETIEYVLDTLPNPERKLFYYFAENSARHLLQGIDAGGWTILVELYNKMFLTTHTLDKVLNVNIPLYHTYLVPKQVFKRMMAFAEKGIPRIFEMLNFDTHHLPYHIERLHGIFLTLQTADGHLDMWIRLPGLEHKEGLKDPWQEIENAKHAATITP